MEIREFAAALIREVRDEAIRDCDARLLPQAKSPIAISWRKAKVDQEIARVLIPDVVDAALFSLLNAIDGGRLNLKFRSQDGKEIDLSTEGLGELAGWYGGGGGWLSKYSKERYFDYLADLVKPPN